MTTKRTRIGTPIRGITYASAAAVRDEILKIGTHDGQPVHRVKIKRRGSDRKTTHFDVIVFRKKEEEINAEAQAAGEPGTDHARKAKSRNRKRSRNSRTSPAAVKDSSDHG